MNTCSACGCERPRLRTAKSDECGFPTDVACWSNRIVNERNALQQKCLSLEKELATRGMAAESALNHIAKACGCAEWEYPGQVINDTLSVVKERDVLRDEVERLRDPDDNFACGKCPLVASAAARRDEVKRLTRERVNIDALLELLADDVAFAIDTKDRGICYNVLCSDTFAWACADGEGLTIESAPTVLNIYKREGSLGVMKWVQEQRGGPGKSPFIAPVQEMVKAHDDLRDRNERLERFAAAARESVKLAKELPEEEDSFQYLLSLLKRDFALLDEKGGQNG